MDFPNAQVRKQPVSAKFKNALFFTAIITVGVVLWLMATQFGII